MQFIHICFSSQIISWKSLLAVFSPQSSSSRRAPLWRMVNFFFCDVVYESGECVYTVGQCPHYEAVAIYVLSSRKHSLEAPPTLRLRELHSNLEAAFTFALESSPKRLGGCVCKSLKLPIPRRIMDLDKKDIHRRRRRRRRRRRLLRSSIYLEKSD